MTSILKNSNSAEDKAIIPCECCQSLMKDVCGGRANICISSHNRDTPVNLEDTCAAAQPLTCDCCFYNKLTVQTFGIPIDWRECDHSECPYLQNKLKEIE